MEPTRIARDRSISPERAEMFRRIIEDSMVVEDRGYIEPCWRSTRSPHANGGYTQIMCDGTSWLTHRLAYLVFVGEIPPLMKVRHKCGLNSCCNPAHLTLSRSVTSRTVLPNDAPDKVCIKCKERKRKDEFGRDSQRGDGIAAYCRSCRSAFMRRSYHGRTPEQQAMHKERHNDWQRANKDKVRVTARRANLKKIYGLTLEEYNAMLESQGNACVICRSPTASSNGKAFHVDHCHDTGAVRGILCPSCNVALGGFGDNAALLRRAAEYIESMGKM